ncbi:methyltransferase [Amycolatopsis speibonae]|uniref:Methyltransferase n=1 Tax=Amycolatopsis speibonae TaxID=1450224 RepID=A0ABV7P3T6_9PSEU
MIDGVDVTDQKKLMELVSGLWVSKTLTTAHEIGLFDLLAKHPGSTMSELADLLTLAERPTRSLVTVCVGLDLLVQDSGRYSNSRLSSRLLVCGEPDYFGGWVEMIDRHDYPGWLRLGEALRENRPTTFDLATQNSMFSETDPVVVDTFWEAMYAVSAPTARVFAATVDLGRPRALLDVGGGGAAWDIALCERYPGLTATVLDQPFVCDLTRRNISRAGLADRITVTPGDFLADDPLPQGYDTILLAWILHDWNDDDVRALLAKCHTALAPGGQLVISELTLDETGDGPLDAALIGLVMQVETWGRAFTAGELTHWLGEKGYTEIRTQRYDGLAGNTALIARKPEA